jgi:hypothetical protein
MAAKHYFLTQGAFMQLLDGRVARTLQNLQRINPNSGGAPSAMPITDKGSISRNMPALAAGLLLVLSGCGPAVTPQAVEVPRAEPVAASVAAAVPAEPTELQVDHAWVKDADTAGERTVQRQAMEALRAKVVAGGAFLDSWNQLELNGTLWHVAERETYASDVLPAGARNLPVGSISPILPGDGGLHLFRILGREAR